jgi:DNA-binding response OmpR family regulator
VDGFALAAEIRKINYDIPIIFLSAKTLKEDRIQGLKLGADDYIIKPFSMEELLLKIGIFLTRAKKSNEGTPPVYQIGGFTFNHENYELNNPYHTIRLTQKEANLLKFFVENKNRVLKREEILLQLWGDDDYFLGRSLDVFISRLRKIFADEKKVQIKNIHGIGFEFLIKEA